MAGARCPHRPKSARAYGAGRQASREQCGKEKAHSSGKKCVEALWGENEGKSVAYGAPAIVRFMGFGMNRGGKRPHP